jgi:hypothetical protein
MRALRKHFAELWLSYASVHINSPGVEGPKGWLKQIFKCLYLQRLTFGFASDFP